MIAKKAGRFACALLAVMVSVVAGGSLVQAQTLVSIGVFTNGDNNFSSLIQGRDGAFYGTSLVGASRNDGSVFKVTTSGTITTLHSFCSQSNCVDGYLPYGPLVLGTDGYFYGVAAGGTANMGVIYRISSTGSYKVIHSFLGSDGHGPDGLVWASDGNLYGVTTIGGSLGYGTIFKATTSGVVTTLHNFDFTHGSDPSAAMAQGSDNNFYGTTAQGGTDNSCLGQPCGIVFKMTPSGSFTVLHNFNVNQGFDTFAPVVQAANGTFYGLTQLGGLVNASCPNGCGTLYSITSNGTFQIVHKFQHSDGGNSPGALVQATDGNLYGESPDSPDGFGQVFKLALPTTITEVTTFNPVGVTGGFTAVYQATDGNLYGTYSSTTSTAAGVFRLSVGLAPFVSFVSPTGKVGTTAEILGQGFTGTNSVTFNGIPAAFTVVSDTYLTATVPTPATTGAVVVATPTATLTSNMNFRVTK